MQNDPNTIVDFSRPLIFKYTIDISALIIKVVIF